MSPHRHDREHLCVSPLLLKKRNHTSHSNHLFRVFLVAIVQVAQIPILNILPKVTLATKYVTNHPTYLFLI